VIIVLVRVLTAIFVLDRLLKTWAISNFFQRRAPEPPDIWPSISLIQPITHGLSDLAGLLEKRFTHSYPAPVQHILILDRSASDLHTTCLQVIERYPQVRVELIMAEEPGLKTASKTAKLLAGLEAATGEVYCFIDDDIWLREGGLQSLVCALTQAHVGASFGLACYTNWGALGSSLMSLFVNSNALLSYIPISYLTEPFTITGHCFALYRERFEQIGGFSGMLGRIDDDHELARRCQRAGLRIVQTPMIYDVNNDLPSFASYLLQMRRWFVFPKQTMLPHMSRRDQVLSGLASITHLLPGFCLLIACLTRSKLWWRACALQLGTLIAVYAWLEKRYLQRATPWYAWLLLPVVGLYSAWHALWIMLWRSDQAVWRGQRMRVMRDGRFEVLNDE
jgi:ceramide glucosyltransferase